MTCSLLDDTPQTVRSVELLLVKSLGVTSQQAVVLVLLSLPRPSKTFNNLGELILGSLHNFHVIHSVSRNYTWNAGMLCVISGSRVWPSFCTSLCCYFPCLLLPLSVLDFIQSFGISFSIPLCSSLCVLCLLQSFSLSLSISLLCSVYLCISHGLSVSIIASLVFLNLYVSLKLSPSHGISLCLFPCVAVTMYALLPVSVSLCLTCLFSAFSLCSQLQSSMFVSVESLSLWDREGNSFASWLFTMEMC